MAFNYKLDFCKITLAAKIFARNNYFPLLKPITPKDARRRLMLKIAKQKTTATHHYIPVLFTQKEYEKRCKKRRKEDYGKKKHGVIEEYKYFEPIINPENESHKKLMELLKTKKKLPGMYAYEVEERKCCVVLDGAFEAAVRDGDVIDVMVSDRRDKMSFRIKGGERIVIDFKDYIEGGALFEGEGNTTAEIELKHHYGKQTMGLAEVFEAKERGANEDELEMMRLAAMKKKKGDEEEEGDWKDNLMKLTENLGWEDFEEEEVKVQDKIEMIIADMNKTRSVAERLLAGGEEVMRQLPLMSEIPELIENMGSGEPCELAYVTGVRVKIGNKERFLAGQFVTNEQGETFVPGQTVKTNNGEEYMPGFTCNVEGTPTLVPGLIMADEEDEAVFLPGQAVITEDGELKLSQGEKIRPTGMEQMTMDEEDEDEMNERRRRRADEKRKRREERERLEREKLERERLEQLEKERLERERLEQIERERQALLNKKDLSDEERRKLEELERQRLEQLEKERLAREERERLEALQKERDERERERLAKIEKDRLEKDRLERERLERERLELERLAGLDRDKMSEEERRRLEELEREREDRLEQERRDRERAERERLELERLAALDRDGLSEEERRKLEKLEKEKQARLEKERLERERRERLEQLDRERLERERLEAKRLAEERERLERERLERERAEIQRLAAADREKLSEEDRLRLQKYERERRERLERERLEKERLELERLEREREKQERARLEAEERERLERERLEEMRRKYAPPPLPEYKPQVIKVSQQLQDFRDMISSGKFFDEYDDEELRKYGTRKNAQLIKRMQDQQEKEKQRNDEIAENMKGVINSLENKKAQLLQKLDEVQNETTTFEDKNVTYINIDKGMAVAKQLGLDGVEARNVADVMLSITRRAESYPEKWAITGKNVQAAETAEETITEVDEKYAHCSENVKDTLKTAMVAAVEAFKEKPKDQVGALKAVGKAISDAFDKDGHIIEQLCTSLHTSLERNEIFSSTLKHLTQKTNVSKVDVVKHVVENQQESKEEVVSQITQVLQEENDVMGQAFHTFASENTSMINKIVKTLSESVTGLMSETQATETLQKAIVKAVKETSDQNLCAFLATENIEQIRELMKEAIGLARALDLNDVATALHYLSADPCSLDVLSRDSVTMDILRRLTVMRKLAGNSEEMKKALRDLQKDPEFARTDPRVRELVRKSAVLMFDRSPLQSSSEIPSSLLRSGNILAMEDFLMQRNKGTLLINKKGIQCVVPREASRYVLAGKTSYTLIDESGVTFFAPMHVFNVLKLGKTREKRLENYPCVGGRERYSDKLPVKIPNDLGVSEFKYRGGGGGGGAGGAGAHLSRCRSGYDVRYPRNYMSRLYGML